MAMIPPSAPAPEQAPLTTGHSTSARAGHDPATGKPLATAPAAQPPREYSAEEMRKINAATGRGFRREAPTTKQESGEPITLRSPNGVPMGCKYCHVNPCTGVSWIFEGEVRFRCDACGRGQKLGVTGDVAQRTHAQLEGMDRAEKNRGRLWREDDVRRDEERRRQMENIAQNPDNPYLSAVKDLGFVDDTFLS